MLGLYLEKFVFAKNNMSVLVSWQCSQNGKVIQREQKKNISGKMLYSNKIENGLRDMINH